MFKSWRLRTRLIVTYVSLILLGFVGLSLLAGNQISAGAVEDFERSLETQAALIARNLREPLEHFSEGEGSYSSMQTAVNSLANDFNLQITLVGPDGFAWLSSDDSVGNVNLGSNPEVVAALDRSGIVFDTRNNEQNVPTIYTAVAVTEDGYLLSVVQVAAPASATASEPMPSVVTSALTSMPYQRSCCTLSGLFVFSCTERTPRASSIDAATP